MARPRSFDKDAALEVALELFWRDGYEKVSTAKLATAMGIGQPSLYAAFGDKRALHDQAVALYSQRLDAGLDRDLAEPTARAAMERLLRSSLEHFTAAGTPPGCLVMGDPMLVERRRITRDRIRDRLRRAVDDGELASTADADALATYFDTILTGLAAQARDGQTRDQLRSTTAIAMNAWPA